MVNVPETRYAKTVDGIHIAYRVVGGGPIDLVWAPGTVSHVELYWEEPALVRFIGRLASFFTGRAEQRREWRLRERLASQAVAMGKQPACSSRLPRSAPWSSSMTMKGAPESSVPTS